MDWIGNLTNNVQSGYEGLKQTDEKKMNFIHGGFFVHFQDTILVHNCSFYPL